MKKMRYFALALFLSHLVIFSTPSHSAPIEQEIAKSYAASDYETTARRLEEQIEEQKLRDLKTEKVEYFGLYTKYLLLCHFYVWRLNKPDAALSKYRELNELRQSYQSASKFPQLELLSIGEIYEVKNDYPKARESYQNLLKELVDFNEREENTLSILVCDDLMKFVKYQIDGLRLKKSASAERKEKPLLARLKLSSQMTHQFFPFLAFSLAPAGEHILSPDKPIDLVNKIKQSPPDLSSMIQNYALLLAASASTVDESSEKAMEAYLSKYPESYYSLQLRYLFYKFFKENGQTNKAERLAKEFDKIAAKKGMELIIGPDKRFSSPEKTWETFRNALIAGDIDLTMECYVPGEWKERKIFTLFGREKMKEIGRSMGNIHKVKTGETTAEYMIIKKKDGKEISYAIRFQNIDGEWKMYEF
jgi:hypothetical protein